MNQKEFEKSIMGKNLVERKSFFVLSIQPFFGDGFNIHNIRIVQSFIEEAEKKVKSFVDKDTIWDLINITTPDDIDRGEGLFQDGISSKDRFISIGHLSDRTNVAYANLYRGIKSIAEFCEDTWFLLWDDCSNYSDEYRIRKGKLEFIRHEHPNIYLNRARYLFSIKDNRIWKDAIVRSILDSLSFEDDYLKENMETLKWCETHDTNFGPLLHAQTMYHEFLEGLKKPNSFLAKLKARSR